MRHHTKPIRPCLAISWSLRAREMVNYVLLFGQRI